MKNPMGYEITKGKRLVFFLLLPCMIITITLLFEMVVNGYSFARGGVPFENPTVSKPITWVFLFRVFVTIWAVISLFIFFTFLKKKSIIIEYQNGN